MFNKMSPTPITNQTHRRLLIFSMIWMGTKDIYISLTLTAAFYILTNHLFNENSRMCMLPEKWLRIQKAIDTNNDGVISDKEIDHALKVLERARRESFKSR